MANVGEDRDIGDPQIVNSLLDEMGHDAPEIVADRAIPRRRAQLRENTERAIEIGIFGSPNWLLAGELFLGEEALADAVAWAVGKRR